MEVEGGPLQQPASLYGPNAQEAAARALQFYEGGSNVEGGRLDCNCRFSSASFHARNPPDPRCIG